jgi:acetylornithine deacetylase/succinyl-diaminopimelate desuccinylase family protein
VIRLARFGPLPARDTSGTVQRIRDCVDPRALLDAARALVRIPTENPPGDERRALVWIEPRLRALGFKVTRAVSPHGRWNLLAERAFGSAPPRGRSRVFLFNGHVDVVPHGDARAWRRPPFEARVHGGKLHGRGAADMKGGIAAFVEAVAAVSRAGVRSPHRVAIHLVSDEESLGVEGTGFLTDRRLVRADLAVVGEPTNLAPATAAKGTLRGFIHVRGKAAHAATPERGLNAIVLASHVIERLAALKFQAEHPLLGRPTLNVATIHGGLRHNMVPPLCTVEFDRRVVPGETAASARAGIARVLAEVRRAHPRLQARIEWGLYGEPSEIPERAEVARLAIDAIRDLEGRRARPVGLLGTTDARYLIRKARIPTLILGPGDLAQAHSVDEFVRVEDLRRAAAIYAVMLCRFLESA